MGYFEDNLKENKRNSSLSKPGINPENSATVADFMSGAFWREHAMKDLIPYWYEHVRDEKHGAFYTNLSRDWKPLPPWDKIPAMISRHVFGFSTAYLLSGEVKYLEAAHEGANFLMEHAWDKKYGGWFDKITKSGEPKDTTKTINVQLYSNVGLAMYYYTTGDSKALSYIKKSIEIQQTFGHDKEFGGYYQALNRDLSVKDSGKNKHAHFGYVGSLTLYLWLATRTPEILKWECHLTDLTLEKMMDLEEGWVNGYVSKFDRQWKLIPGIVDGVDLISIGAQLTAALSFLRLYHQTGNSAYLERGKALSDKINQYGWDAERGGWINLVERTNGHRPVASPKVEWWIQIYGSFLQLQLYRITQDVQYLERFKKSEDFYFRYFIDREHGGVFQSVSPEGICIGNGGKAEPWRTSFHEMEHGLLNYLYLNLYVNKEPAVLHFMLDSNEPSKKHFVSIVDDSSVQIAGVKINGQPWSQFDALERSVTLPVGKNLKVDVTFKTLGHETAEKSSS